MIASIKTKKHIQPTIKDDKSLSRLRRSTSPLTAS